MGSELVNDSSSPNGDGERTDSVPLSFTEIFEQQFPYYLAIGMSPEQYWDSDCTLVRFYHKAHMMRIQEKNQEMWLQGKYFYDALCNVSPVLHAFAKNGTQPLPYPKEPYPITLEEQKEREAREEKAKFDKIAAKTMAWANRVNNRRAKITSKEAQDGGKYD